MRINLSGQLNCGRIIDNVNQIEVKKTIEDTYAKQTNCFHHLSNE